jgi:hypothetical protein
LHDTISVDHIYRRITRTDPKRLYYLLDKDSTYNVVRIMMNRRHLEEPTMAQTTDRRLALVPKNTGVGDEVAILFGADVPFVLRRKADRAAHELIGECYVHGLMDGATIEALEQGSVQRTMFALT